MHEVQDVMLGAEKMMIEYIDLDDAPGAIVDAVRRQARSLVPVWSVRWPQPRPRRRHGDGRPRTAAWSTSECRTAAVIR